MFLYRGGDCSYQTPHDCLTHKDGVALDQIQLGLGRASVGVLAVDEGERWQTFNEETSGRYSSGFARVDSVGIDPGVDMGRIQQ